MKLGSKSMNWLKQESCSPYKVKKGCLDKFAWTTDHLMKVHGQLSCKKFYWHCLLSTLNSKQMLKCMSS